MKSLEPKYAARAEARAKLDAAMKAVERAKRFADIAAEQVKSLEQRTAQAEDSQASQLAALFASGNGLESVSARPEDAGEGLNLELAAARHDLSIKIKALAALESARAEAQTQLAQAERAVVTAVDQILTDEITARARKVDDLLNEAKRLGTALKYFAVAAEVNAARIVQPSTLRVLDRLSLPLVNAMDIPIDLAASGDVAQFRDWAAQREQMIAGTTSDATPLEAA